MSNEPVLNTSQETLQFMKKVEEKKQILEEAEAEYNRLCREVDRVSLELSQLKMECFKVEGLNQELGIRIEVYEVREKELKEQDEKAKKSIKEAKSRLAQELELRDTFDRDSSLEVIEMATEFCQFKDSCFKSNVLACLNDLKTSHSTFTSEIETKMQNLCVGSDEPQESDPSVLLQQVYQPKLQHQYSISVIRELQELVKEEVSSVRAENVTSVAQVDLLLNEKSKLLKELDSLKKSWNS